MLNGPVWFETRNFLMWLKKIYWNWGISFVFKRKHINKQMYKQLFKQLHATHWNTGNVFN